MGAFEATKSKIKQAAGHLTGDEDLEARGKSQAEMLTDAADAHDLAAQKHKVVLGRTGMIL